MLNVSSQLIFHEKQRREREKNNNTETEDSTEKELTHKPHGWLLSIKVKKKN